MRKKSRYVYKSRINIIKIYVVMEFFYYYLSYIIYFYKCIYIFNYVFNKKFFDIIVKIRIFLESFFFLN